MPPPEIGVISGYPPGAGGVGELLVRDYARTLASEGVVCLALPPATYRDQRDAELAPHILHRPAEPVQRTWPGRLGTLQARAHLTRLERQARSRANAAITWLQGHSIQRLWIVLDSITAILMTPTLFEAFDPARIHLQVWDPPGPEAHRLGFDRRSCARIQQRFGQALGRAHKVAVVSENMARDYAEHYQANTTIVRPAFTAPPNLEPRQQPHGEAALCIGFAGGLYATDAWNALLAALDARAWTLHDRSLSLRLIGPDFRLRSRQPARVEWLGWHDTVTTTELLRQTDLCYLPYPFGADKSEVTRLAFPTKLSHYFATGLPTFIHAPQQSSLEHFATAHQLPCCTSLEPEAIATALDHLLQPGTYAATARQQHELGRQHFSPERARSDFRTFLDLPA